MNVWEMTPTAIKSALANNRTAVSKAIFEDCKFKYATIYFEHYKGKETITEERYGTPSIEEQFVDETYLHVDYFDTGREAKERLETVGKITNRRYIPIAAIKNEAI